jgi:hypothetical protein
MVHARVLIVLTALCCLSVAPSAAAAQRTKAPPGLSGVDEYLETIPTASGPSAGGGGGSARTPAATGASPSAPLLTARTVRALKRGGGKDGEAVARFAAQSAPQRPGHGAPAARSPRGTSSSVARQLGAALGGSGGAGWVFPLGLAASVLVLVAMARRRRAER